MAMNLTTTSCLTIIAMFIFSTVNGSPVPTKIGSSPGVEHRQQEHSPSSPNHKNSHFLSEVDDKSPSFGSREKRTNYSQKSAENNEVKQTKPVDNGQRNNGKGNFTIENALQNAVEEVREQKKFEMIEESWKHDFMMSFQQQFREKLRAQGYGDMLA